MGLAAETQRRREESEPQIAQMAQIWNEFIGVICVICGSSSLVFSAAAPV